MQRGERESRECGPGAGAGSAPPDLAGRIDAAEELLRGVYDLDLPVRARDHLMPAEDARRLLPPVSPRSGLLVVEAGEELLLGLYLDPRDAGDPDAIAEETSHFVCLAWHALEGRRVSRLLLEVQGEIDRFVAARFEGRDPLGHFSGFRFDDFVRGAVLARYRAAHRMAARYCRDLSARYPSRRDTPALLAELRRFYRAPADRKLSALSS